MSSKKNAGQINTPRRQHLRSAAHFLALGVTGLGDGFAWAKQGPSATSLPQAPKPEKRSITVATTNISALPYLPLLVAQHKGFFSQQGLELQINEQQSAARAIAAVASGSADIVCGWLENVFAAPGRALALQSFVLFGTAPMMSMGLAMRPGAKDLDTRVSARLALLRGRKMGVVSLNSPTHTVALAALRRAGLRASDVAFVSVGSPASAQAALRSGQIDALMYMDPLMLQLEQRGEIQILADLRNPPAAYEVLGMHLPSSCVAASQDFLQRLPGTAQACSDALVHALQWLAQASLRDVLRLQEALQDTAPGLDVHSFVASFERLRLAYSINGQCSAQSAGDLLQAMHDADPSLRLEKIDAMQSINNTLVQRSWAKLKN